MPAAPLFPPPPESRVDSPAGAYVRKLTFQRKNGVHSLMAMLQISFFGHGVQVTLSKAATLSRACGKGKI